MNNFWRACVSAGVLLTSSPSWAGPPRVVCDSTAPPVQFTDCLLRMAADLDDELARTQAHSAVQDERVKLKDEALGVLQADNTRLQDALAGAAARDASVLASPVFWLGIGLGLGVLASVAVGAVAVQAWKH